MRNLKLGHRIEHWACGERLTGVVTAIRQINSDKVEVTTKHKPIKWHGEIFTERTIILKVENSIVIPSGHEYRFLDADYNWSNQEVLEFCRQATIGQYGIFKGCKTLESKLEAFIKNKEQ